MLRSLCLQQRQLLDQLHKISCTNLSGFAEPQLDSPLLSCCLCCCRTSCVILKFLVALFSFCLCSSYQGENSIYLKSLYQQPCQPNSTLPVCSALVCFCVFTYIGFGSLYLDSSNVVIPHAWFPCSCGVAEAYAKARLYAYFSRVHRKEWQPPSFL